MDGRSSSISIVAFIVASDRSIVDIRDIGPATGGFNDPAFDLEYQYGPRVGGGTGGSSTWTRLFSSAAGDEGTPTLQ